MYCLAGPPVWRYGSASLHGGPVGNQLEQLRLAVADRYRVEDEIGRGGMATVYRAHDLKHDRAVALKLLRPELAASLGTERFLREITLTARLARPGTPCIPGSSPPPTPR